MNRILRKILLLGLSMTFILSSILKTISIYSFSQIVNSFCGLLGMDVLYGYGYPLAIAIIAFELLIGVCAFIRRLQRFAIWTYTIVLGFFTYITFINYTDLYGGIESCGCFGELIHFTPASSFYKNLILFALSLVLLGIHVINTYRQELRYIPCLLLAVLLLGACQNRIDNALELAGDKRQELEKVLNRYKYNHNTQKFSAEKIPIENMLYHYTYQDAVMLHYDSAYATMAQKQFRDSVFKKQQGTSISYIYASNNNDWLPAYYSMVNDCKVIIPQIPSNVVYIIAFFEDRTTIPVDNPLIITKESETEIIEINSFTWMTQYLMRKYPLIIGQKERILT